MIRLSKRVEYALLAIHQMASRPGTVVSAKDIAMRFNISQTLLAKVLQDLVRAGHVRSNRGVHGGYELAVMASDLSVGHVIEAIEGRHGGLVDCQEQADHDCSTSACCTIKQPLAVLQERINATFASMSVHELVHPLPRIEMELP